MSVATVYLTEGDNIDQAKAYIEPALLSQFGHFTRRVEKSLRLDPFTQKVEETSLVVYSVPTEEENDEILISIVHEATNINDQEEAWFTDFQGRVHMGKNKHYFMQRPTGSGD